MLDETKKLLYYLYIITLNLSIIITTFKQIISLIANLKRHSLLIIER